MKKEFPSGGMIIKSFRRSGQGMNTELELIQIAHHLTFRLIAPNCLGVMTPSRR